MNRYMAFRLGCVECQFGGEVIGFYATREQAAIALAESDRREADDGFHPGNAVVYDVHDAIGFAEFQDVR